MLKEKMKDNKKLYDACRKFVYFYKRYQRVKDLKDDYGYDKDVANLADKFEKELVDAYDDVCYAILNPYVDSVRIEKDFEEAHYRMGVGWSEPFVRGITTTVDGEEFSTLMSRMIRKKYSFLKCGDMVR